MSSRVCNSSKGCGHSKGSGSPSRTGSSRVEFHDAMLHNTMVTGGVSNKHDVDSCLWSGRQQ